MNLFGLDYWIYLFYMLIWEIQFHWLLLGTLDSKSTYCWLLVLENWWRNLFQYLVWKMEIHSCLISINFQLEPKMSTKTHVEVSYDSRQQVYPETQVESTNMADLLAAYSIILSLESSTLVNIKWVSHIAKYGALWTTYSSFLAGENGFSSSACVYTSLAFLLI